MRKITGYIGIMPLVVEIVVAFTRALVSLLIGLLALLGLAFHLEAFPVVAAVALAVVEQGAFN